MNNFDSENNVSPVSDKHAARYVENDLMVVIKELQEVRAFKVTSDKVHNSFETLSTNFTRTLDEKSVNNWMVEHLAQLIIV